MPRGDSTQAGADHGRPALEGEQPRDHVIGIDTHRDTLAAAAVSPIGYRPHRCPRERTGLPAPAGLRPSARSRPPMLGFEGVGSFGAGLVSFLDQAGERVVEVLPPKRAAVRRGRKTDMIDAIRAAKEASASGHLIQPRLRGEREALRVLLVTRHGAVLASTAAINQFKSLIVSAPDNLRADLRKLKRPAQIATTGEVADRHHVDAGDPMCGCNRARTVGGVLEGAAGGRVGAGS
ncbi:transposase [Streptomyces sp. NPDC006283]|uniref:IS110 family transposase n=1 Tax=Streptomyces sp. NPDC006283 TaxID=3156741 RepID=UPI0033BD662E